MENYKLMFMSFDGETVNDSVHESIESAIEAIDNIGSKWYFYPYCLITKNQTVKEIFGSLVNMQTGESCLNERFGNKRIKTVKKAFNEASKKTEAVGLDVIDFEHFILFN